MFSKVGYNFPEDGGNSIEDEWPGEPSDAYWRDELDRADRDLRQVTNQTMKAEYYI